MASTEDRELTFLKWGIYRAISVMPTVELNRIAIRFDDGRAVMAGCFWVWATGREADARFGILWPQVVRDALRRAS